MGMLASERTPGIEKCCELATDLLAAATHDSDAYLAVPLPHTGILKQGQPRDVQEGELCSTDWPEGCLGYAFNLVRPTQSGLRAEVLYQLMGKTLVFTTFELASSYAQFVTQHLGVSMPDVVTLDGHTISSRDFVANRTFRAQPLATAPSCIGCNVIANTAGIERLQARRDVLQALVSALQLRERASARLVQARQAVTAARAKLTGHP